MLRIRDSLACLLVSHLLRVPQPKTSCRNASSLCLCLVGTELFELQAALWGLTDESEFFGKARGAQQ